MKISKKEQLAVKLAGNEDYKKINKKLLEVEKALVSTLTKEQKELFFNYEEAVAELNDFSQDFYFQRGLLKNDILKEGEH